MGRSISNRRVEDKYLNVLEHAKNVAKTNDVMVAWLGYREVATHYGCAYMNDGYRAMEKMVERVPSVSRNLLAERRTRSTNSRKDVTAIADSDSLIHLAEIDLLSCLLR